MFIHELVLLITGTKLLSCEIEKFVESPSCTLRVILRIRETATVAHVTFTIIQQSTGFMTSCTWVSLLLFPPHLLFPPFFLLLLPYYLLRPQFRFGDKLLEVRVVCPQNGTAVLKGLILIVVVTQMQGGHVATSLPPLVRATLALL